MSLDNHAIQDLLQQMKARSDPIAALKEHLLIALLMRCMATDDGSFDLTIGDINEACKHLVHLEILDENQIIRLHLKVNDG